MDVKEVRCPYISFSFLFFRFMFFGVPVILFFHCLSFLFIFDFPELHSYFRSSAFLFFQSFICLFFRVSFLFSYNVSFSFLAVFAPFFLFWSVFFFLCAEPFFILKLSVLYFQECPSVVELWQEYCFHLFLVEKLDVYIRWKEAAHWRSIKPLSNLQENTRDGVTFSIAFQTRGLHLIKKTILELLFSIFLNF